MFEKMNLINSMDFFKEETNDFKNQMKIDALLVDIACEFIKYRDNNKLTQKQLAEKLQITQAMVSKLESGEYNPTIKLLFEISQKLSWNFKIEFNETSDTIDYRYNNENKIVQINSEYVGKMGLAS